MKREQVKKHSYKLRTEADAALMDARHHEMRQLRGESNK